MKQGIPNELAVDIAEQSQCVGKNCDPNQQETVELYSEQFDIKIADEEPQGDDGFVQSIRNGHEKSTKDTWRSVFGEGEYQRIRLKEDEIQSDHRRIFKVGVKKQSLPQLDLEKEILKWIKQTFSYKKKNFEPGYWETPFSSGLKRAVKCMNKGAIATQQICIAIREKILQVLKISKQMTLAINSFGVGHSASQGGLPNEPLLQPTTANNSPN